MYYSHTCRIMNMSNEELQKGFELGIIHELTKMKYRTEEAKLEIQKDPIDRLRIKVILFDLSAIVHTIHAYLKSVSKDLSQKNELGTTRENVLQIYQKLGDSLLNDARIIDDKSSYPDSQIRNRIFQIIYGLGMEMNYAETYMLAVNQSISPLAKILEFIEKKPLGLDEKWVAAACYLSAFDIMLNKKREHLKISKKPEDEKKISFYDKFDEVVKILESKNGEQSKLVKQLPKVFWQIRVDVIHYGYVPTQEELDLIIKWSNNIMKVISEEQNN